MSRRIAVIALAIATTLTAAALLAASAVTSVVAAGLPTFYHG